MPETEPVDDLATARDALFGRLENCDSDQNYGTLAKTLYGVLTKINTGQVDDLTRLRGKLRERMMICTSDQAFSTMSNVLVSITAKLTELDPPTPGRRDLAVDRFLAELGDRLA